MVESCECESSGTQLGRVFQVQGPVCTKIERCEHVCGAGGVSLMTRDKT